MLALLWELLFQSHLLIITSLSGARQQAKNFNIILLNPHDNHEGCRYATVTAVLQLRKPRSAEAGLELGNLSLESRLGE